MLRHAYVSGVSDGGDSNLVRPSDWNDRHYPSPALKHTWMEEDFLFGSNSSSSIGKHKLSGAGGAFAFISGEAGHPGIFGLTANSAASARVHTDITNNAGKYTFGAVLRMVSVVRFPSFANNNTAYRFGLMTDINAAPPGTNFIGFQLLQNGGGTATFDGIIKSVSGTTTKTGSAPSTSTWYQFDAVNSGSNTWEFFVNGASLGAATNTNAPSSGAACFGWNFDNRTGAGRRYDIDYMAIHYYSGAVTRYT